MFGHDDMPEAEGLNHEMKEAKESKLQELIDLLMSMQDEGDMPKPEGAVEISMQGELPNEDEVLK